MRYFLQNESLELTGGIFAYFPILGNPSITYRLPSTIRTGEPTYFPDAIRGDPFKKPQKQERAAHFEWMALSCAFHWLSISYRMALLCVLGGSDYRNI